MSAETVLLIVIVSVVCATLAGFVAYVRKRGTRPCAEAAREGEPCPETEDDTDGEAEVVATEPRRRSPSAAPAAPSKDVTDEALRWG